MPRPALVLPALAVATALVASSAGVSAAGAATPHGRSALSIHATKSHHVVVPANIRPGITHLRNTGKGEIIVVEAKHPDRSSTEQVAKAINGTSPKPLLKNYRLVAFALPKAGIYSKLTRGTYYFALGVNKIKASRIATTTVSGPRVDARVPASRDLSVSSQRNLSLPGTLNRSGWLHVRSMTGSLAYFMAEPVRAHTTAAQLRSLVADPTQKKLSAATDFRFNSPGFEGLTIIAPHGAFWVHYRDTPGRFVAAVFGFTKHGETHLHHGSVRILTLK